MKKFKLPTSYKSNIIESTRQLREKIDPRKKDISPTIIELENIHFYIGRHFGFCYGVKNAIEICYSALKNNPHKNIYLLSEMIHNQIVNNDLLEKGISFIMDTKGKQLIDWNTITSDDIVIIPAFGTSLEIIQILKEKNINTEKFDTTCPFVSKVWNRAELIAKKGYTIIVHGKANHEETRSTFSRAQKHGATIIVENIKDVQLLCQLMITKDEITFQNHFKNKYSKSFDFKTDLSKIGVVNQTTMLASETKDIISLFTNTFENLYGKEYAQDHIANTRDTLCYATNENQESTISLLENNVDLAIIVGGYNSSNTTHLVELSTKKTNTFFINSEEKISLDNSILHFDIDKGKEVLTKKFLPNRKCKVILTSGASCPDVILEEIMIKLAKIKNQPLNKNAILDKIRLRYNN